MKPLLKYWHSKLLEKPKSLDGIMELKKAREVLTRFGIIMPLTLNVLKDMEKIGLVSIINQRTIKINKKV